MTLHEFHATATGYNRKMAHEENNYRKLGLVFAQVFAQKGKRIKLKDVWSIPLLDKMDKPEKQSTAADGEYFKKMVKMFGGIKTKK